MSTENGLLGRAKKRYGQLGAAAYAFVLTIVVLALTGLVGLVTQLP